MKLEARHQVTDKPLANLLQNSMKTVGLRLAENGGSAIYQVLAVSYIVEAVGLNEDKKVRHVINNASGTLRPLVEGLLKDQVPAEGLQQFRALVFYSAQMEASGKAQHSAQMEASGKAQQRTGH